MRLHRLHLDIRTLPFERCDLTSERLTVAAVAAVAAVATPRVTGHIMSRPTFQVMFCTTSRIVKSHEIILSQL